MIINKKYISQDYNIGIILIIKTCTFEMVIASRSWQISQEESIMNGLKNIRDDIYKICP